MKIEINSNDIHIYQSILKTYEKVFISPYHSFKDTELSLKDISSYLNEYLNLLENDFLYLNNHDYLIPPFSFSDDFHLFLKLALIKKSPFAKETLELIQKIYNPEVFKENKLYSNNPYLDIFNQLLNDSFLLVNQSINYSTFIDNNKKNIDFLFPTGDDLTGEHADLLYLSEPIIFQLKEKIYLNLLSHFILFPEQYIDVSYLFIDFIDFFSFNKNQPYSYSHLKNIFLKLEQKHFKIISSLKKHTLYNLFIESLFIENIEPHQNLDNDSLDYVYYFDFYSFNTLIHKNILIDNLFDSSLQYQNIKDYFHSIFEKNKQDSDLQRFKKLMIVYEKNKLEHKLLLKNTEDSIIKI